MVVLLCEKSIWRKKMDNATLYIINSHEFQDMMANSFADYDKATVHQKSIQSKKVMQYFPKKVAAAIPETVARLKRDDENDIYIEFGTIDSVSKYEDGHYHIYMNEFGHSTTGFCTIINVADGYVPQRGDKLMTRRFSVGDTENDFVERVDVFLYDKGGYKPVAINCFRSDDDTAEQVIATTDNMLCGKVKEAAEKIKEDLHLDNKKQRKPKISFRGIMPQVMKHLSGLSLKS